MDRASILENAIVQAESRIQSTATALGSVAENLPGSMELDNLAICDAASVTYGVYYELLALVQFLKETLNRKAPNA